MKKYFVLSFLILILATPTFAKGPNTTQGQPTTLTKSISPTGNQVKNENQVQTKNQGEDQQLSVQTQESEQLNQEFAQTFTKVSDQVHQLINTVGTKGGIGQQVKEIAQNQTKLQDQIKGDFDNLKSRSSFAKLMIGSDKKTIQSLEQKMEQNRLMIQQLEQLKLKTKNQADLQQLQETIDLMLYQNTSLQNVVDKETKINGLFGWLVNLFK